MDQVSGSAARPNTGKVLGCIAAALLFAAAIGLPQAADAAHGGGGGGGFHGGGGGFHGGGGGFHGGGFHGGGFHAGGFHGGGFHGGGFHRGVGVGVGFGGLYAPYGYGWDYSYPYADTYGYPDYGYYQQPYATQYWYYCSNPAGYYPYVAQCNTGWQTVPAS
jgi:hypothetical protein